jgi:hypothetical protein
LLLLLLRGRLGVLEVGWSIASVTGSGSSSSSARGRWVAAAAAAVAVAVAVVDYLVWVATVRNPEA